VFILVGAAGQHALAQQPPDNVKSDGDANTAMGIDALFHVIGIEGGIWNTAAGAYALQFDTAGYENTALGAYALQDTTSGFQNSAAGAQALQFNTTGNSNTAFGAEALLTNTTGNNNTASGLSALVNNGGGDDNSAFGANALASARGTIHNTAVGSSALIGATSGDNTAVGYGALRGTLSAAQSQNTAVGSQSLNQVGGSGNTALGYRVGFSLANGNDNTAIGTAALLHLGTGSFNIAIGEQSALNLTYGSSNIDIGNVGAAAETGVIRIGTSGTQKTTYVAGISGTPVTGSAVYVTAAGQLGVAPSSERYKMDIAPIGANADKLSELRPVRFHLRSDPGGNLQYGLIAEEVANVYPELVIRDAGGTIQGVHYEELAPMLLSKLQQVQALASRQRRTLAAQQRAIDDLRAQLTQIKQLDTAMQSALLALQAEAARVAAR